MGRGLAARQYIAEPGLLGDYRLATGQETGIPLAEPAASQPNVLVLGDRKLGARILNVVPIGAEDVERHPVRGDHAPAMSLESFPIRPLAGHHRQLERLLR